MRLRNYLVLGFLGLGLTLSARSETLMSKPNDPYFAPFQPVAGPVTKHLILKKGDRLAICGDSITEQKMYSRIIEDYLTMCLPQLQISVRQYGWSGEKAPGFLARMTNDCLRFDPTIATTCYGMNDFQYRPYQDSIAGVYASNQTAIVEAFKAHGVRVILGSAGSVGKIPKWAPRLSEQLLDLNLSLCRFRNLDAAIAEREHVAFADVFWPLLTGAETAKKEYGEDYALNGADGVHPGWAGHTIMAYAFLKAMGLDGRIGTITVNLARNQIKVTEGHRVISANGGVFTIQSFRYPFCSCAAPPTAARYPDCGGDDIRNYQSIRSGMTLVPFNQDLNRFMLIARQGAAQNYTVTWGEDQKTFTADQLSRGINLAAEFPINPFTEAFAEVDAAIAAKQAFETDEIKNQFEAVGRKLTRAAIAERTEKAVAAAEKTHSELAAAVAVAFVPVLHTLKIQPQ